MRNRILINLLLGLLYFLFALSIDYTDLFKVPFILLMQFLPGITFPVSTANYGKLKTPTLKIIAHILFSITIYYSNVWLYSYERDFELSPIFAGLIGSISFLILSKYLLKLKINWNEIIVSCIISGIIFIPTILLKGNGISMGIALLFWTLVNGFVMFKSQNTTANSGFKKLGF